MKISTANNFIASTSSQNKNFSIAASAKAFKILSSSIYQDKIAAIVRELTCNAIDSHRAASNPDPIKVYMPTSTVPEFSVVDQGLGMSKETIEHVYTTYFESTKSDSNEDIGGLGLGSKTPFSYTDSFVVISTFEGMEYHYSAYIGDSGEPCISLVREIETDNPNGVRVNVPVNSSDFWTFSDRARKIFCWYDQIPEVYGMDFVPDEYTRTVVEELNSKGYSIQSTSWGRGTLNLIMGGVQYKIGSIDYFMDHDNSLYKKVKNITEMSYIVIKAEIGDVDIQPSREALSYDDRTKEYICNSVANIARSYTIEIQTQVDALPNEFEIYDYFLNLGLGSLDMFNDMGVTFGTTPLSTYWKSTSKFGYIGECFKKHDYEHRIPSTSVIKSSYGRRKWEHVEIHEDDRYVHMDNYKNVTGLVFINCDGIDIKSKARIVNFKFSHHGTGSRLYIFCKENITDIIKKDLSEYYGDRVEFHNVIDIKNEIKEYNKSLRQSTPKEKRPKIEKTEIRVRYFSENDNQIVKEYKVCTSELEGKKVFLQALTRNKNKDAIINRAEDYIKYLGDDGNEYVIVFVNNASLDRTIRVFDKAGIEYFQEQKQLSFRDVYNLMGVVNVVKKGEGDICLGYSTEQNIYRITRFLEEVKNDPVLGYMFGNEIDYKTGTPSSFVTSELHRLLDLDKNRMIFKRLASKFTYINSPKVIKFKNDVEKNYPLVYYTKLVTAYSNLSETANNHLIEYVDNINEKGTENDNK